MNLKTLLLFLLIFIYGCGTKPETIEVKFSDLKREIESGTITNYDVVLERLKEIKVEVEVAKKGLKAKDAAPFTLLSKAIEDDSIKYISEKRDFELMESSGLNSPLKKLVKINEFLKKYPKSINIKLIEASANMLSNSIKVDLGEITTLPADPSFDIIKTKTNQLIKLLNEADYTRAFSVDYCSFDQGLNNIRQALDNFNLTAISFSETKANISEIKNLISQYLQNAESESQNRNLKIEADIRNLLITYNVNIENVACDAARKHRARKWVIKVKDYYTCSEKKLASSINTTKEEGGYKVELLYSITTKGLTGLEELQTERVKIFIKIPYTNCKLGELQIEEGVVQ